MRLHAKFVVVGLTLLFKLLETRDTVLFGYAVEESLTRIRHGHELGIVSQTYFGDSGFFLIVIALRFLSDVLLGRHMVVDGEAR